MDAATRAFVRQRAGNCCEYCGLPQESEAFFTFHIEHIVARQHGGGDGAENLALACYHCNLHKGRPPSLKLWRAASSEALAKDGSPSRSSHPGVVGPPSFSGRGLPPSLFELWRDKTSWQTSSLCCGNEDWLAKS